MSDLFILICFILPYQYVGMMFSINSRFVLNRYGPLLARFKDHYGAFFIVCTVVQVQVEGDFQPSQPAISVHNFAQFLLLVL